MHVQVARAGARGACVVPRARVAELRTGLIRVQTVLEFSVKRRIMNRLHDQIMTHIQLTGIPRRSTSFARTILPQSRIACRGAESQSSALGTGNAPHGTICVSAAVSSLLKKIHQHTDMVHLQRLVQAEHLNRTARALRPHRRSGPWQRSRIRRDLTVSLITCYFRHLVCRGSLVFPYIIILHLSHGHRQVWRQRRD